MNIIILLLVIFTQFIDSFQHEVTDQVYFDISIDNGKPTKIVIGLFGSVVPKTVRNFKEIALNGINGKSYNGTIFHRVIHKFAIQSGDILFNNGSGVISIYGDEFEDENFDIQHSAPGYVSMANSGPNTNGCQFFITVRPTPMLDGKHVVFGKVIEGQPFIHTIEHVKTDGDDRPLKPVVIVKAGFIFTPEPFYIEDVKYSFWEWIKAGIIPLSFTFTILGFFHWVIRKLDSFRLITEDQHID
nr:peptidyl-prolyl cis-trans isomerase, rhodopsin-specific isozyme-like [Onthophagus taurus]